MINASAFLRLNVGDLVRGIIVAILGSVFAYLLPIFNAQDFQWTQIDWNLVMKIAMSSLVGYLAKNWMTDENGKVLGKIG